MTEPVIIRRKVVRRKVAPRNLPPELLNKRNIILHMRDLANIGDMLEGGAMDLIVKFRKRLHSVGWSYQNIYLLEEMAYSRTNWEELLPHIHSKGSMTDWLGSRHRWTR